MRGAESLTVIPATFAVVASGYSVPSVFPVAPITSFVSASSRAILPFGIVASIISGLLLLMRPAARYVESAAGLTQTDIA